LYHRNCSIRKDGNQYTLEIVGDINFEQIIDEDFELIGNLPKNLEDVWSQLDKIMDQFCEAQEKLLMKDVQSALGEMI
jgi:hypothetical protein